MQVSGDSAAPGYRYRTIVMLRETVGMAATIMSVDLVFAGGNGTLVTAHFDRPISDASNICPASATVSTRELDTTDADPSHAYASTVKATVNFTDGTTFTGTTAGSADVPPLGPTPPQTYALVGVITDAATRAPIAGAQLQATNGTNAGKSATTDAAGAYTMTGLVGETFRLRASASGYSSGEQNVTVPDIPRADFQLQPIVQPACAYTAAANTTGIVSSDLGTFTITVTRTSGACSWTATTDASWISFPGGSSGSGSATLAYSVGPNGFNSRSGAVTIAWTGGGASLVVQQGPHSDFECFVALSKGPEDFDNVPSGGGTLTVFASVYAVPAGRPCTASVSSAVSWMTGGGSISGQSTLTFTVAVNPSPGTARSASITAQTGVKTVTLSVTQR